MKRLVLLRHGQSLWNYEDIVGLNIPTGIPLVYELDDDLRAKDYHYLGTDKDIRKTTE